MLLPFHHYASSYYYYASLLLACLLHNQANSITIIIDGETTNEWATRDEYQRLMESGPSGAGAGPPSLLKLNQEQPRDITQESRAQNRPDSQQYPSSPQEDTLYQQQQQQQQQPLLQQQQQEAKSVAEELESALGRLDLIIEEQQQERLNSNPNKNPIDNKPKHHSTPKHGRDTAPKKLCGRDLMDMLELVCQHRFYGGGLEPQIVEPTIKNKRSSSSSLSSSTFGRQTSSAPDNNDYHGRPLFRRIRGANADCCKRKCHMDELKLYCQQ